MLSLVAKDGSSGESEPFSLEGIVDHGPGEDEEVLQPGQPDPQEDEEAYQSDEEEEQRHRHLDAAQPHIELTDEITSTAHDPAIVTMFLL